MDGLRAAVRRFPALPLSGLGIRGVHARCSSRPARLGACVRHVHRCRGVARTDPVLRARDLRPRRPSMDGSHQVGRARHAPALLRRDLQHELLRPDHTARLPESGRACRRHRSLRRHVPRLVVPPQSRIYGARCRELLDDQRGPRVFRDRQLGRGHGSRGAPRGTHPCVDGHRREYRLAARRARKRAGRPVGTSRPAADCARALEGDPVHADREHRALLGREGPVPLSLGRVTVGLRLLRDRAEHSRLEIRPV